MTSRRANPAHQSKRPSRAVHIAGRSTGDPALALADLMADHASDCRTGRRAQYAAAEDVAGNAAHARADRRRLLLRRHPCATAKAEQARNDHCTNRFPVERIHLVLRVLAFSCTVAGRMADGLRNFAYDFPNSDLARFRQRVFASDA